MSTPDMSSFRPNRGKKLIVDTDFGRYARYPVKTHVVVKGDTLSEIAKTYGLTVKELAEANKIENPDGKTTNCESHCPTSKT